MARDPLEELARLRDRADVLAQSMDAARAGAASYTGADSTGTVEVTVDGAGHVAALTVARRWREQFGAEGLGAAVREAVQAAGLARLRVFGEAFAAQGDADARPRQMPSVADTLAAQLDEVTTAAVSSGQGREALLELLAMAQDVERGIDQVSARLGAVLDATYTGHNGGGEVAVTVTGSGAVTAVRYQRRWLADAHESTIGRQTADALRAAYRQVGQPTAADLVAGTPLGEVAALGQDPFGLARRLRLRQD